MKKGTLEQISSPNRELEKELRDSHVRLRDVPKTEEEWEAFDGENRPSEGDVPPRVGAERGHLRIVSITPREPVPPVEPEAGAEIIPLHRPSRGIVAAERAHISDESQAKFHSRETIERAVRTSRTSMIHSPPSRRLSPLPKSHHGSYTLLWLVAGLSVVVLIVAGAILAWQ